MAVTLNHGDAGFEAAFTAFLSTKREVSEDVDAAVRAILGRVRAQGDEALFDYTRQFDRFDPSDGRLTVTQAEIEAAVASCDPEIMAALTLARDRIASHHARQRPADDLYDDAIGVGLGSRWTAVEAPGL